MVVTVLELLSPSNKVHGSAGRESFLRKRREVYASKAHWMELDLLREGARTTNQAAVGAAEYQAYLSRAGDDRRAACVWPIRLKERLPVIGVPLRGEDADAPLELQEIFAQVYDDGGYDLDLDYRQDPIPPLAGESTSWARGVVGAAQ